MPLPAVVLETGPNPTGTVIWLHGLGADGHDFEAIVPELRLPASLPLRFVFPHAPVRPVTVNGGMKMRAWYDIRSFDAEGRADEAGVLDSCQKLEKLISAEEGAGIARSRIVIAGFSQGGAIVLHHLLTAGHRYAGAMALSTYMPLPALITSADSAVPQDAATPVFMAHGTLDNMVPFAAGEQSAAMVRDRGHPLAWHQYPMGHGVCPEQIGDIRRWLFDTYLPDSASSA